MGKLKGGVVVTLCENMHDITRATVVSFTTAAREKKTNLSTQGDTS